MDNISKEKTINKVQEALNRLSKGESTVNEIRQEFGLSKLDNNDSNKKITMQGMGGQALQKYERGKKNGSKFS